MSLSLPTGQAALSLIFLIGGIVVLMALSLAFLVITFINSSTGYQNSSRALAVASGGANDALLRLARDRTFSGTYSVSLGSHSASVTVTQDSPAPGRATVRSTASVSRYQRRVQAVASVIPATGEVQLVSWEELAF